MKKVLSLLLAVAFTGAALAQQAQPAKPAEQKQEQNQEQKQEQKKEKKKTAGQKKETAPAEQKK